MDRQGQGVRWWLYGSAAFMVIGSIGPWATALGQSVSGIDNTNDGWLVVGAAVLGALLFRAGQNSRAGSVFALLGAAAGTAITLYDRQHIQNAINQGGAFVQALAHVGWGLNVALIASISMGISAIVYLTGLSGTGSSVPGSPPPDDDMPFARTPQPPPD